MNTKLKYTLAFVAVLLIGFVLGFLVSGRLIHSRVNRMQKYYTNQGFRFEFKRMLRPSQEQLKKMKPVLEKYGQKNRENMMLFRQQQQQLMKNLHHDLKPFLSPQQVKRLEMMERRHMHFMRNGSMPHRPMYPGRGRPHMPEN
jgi:hypothetical protein